MIRESHSTKVHTPNPKLQESSEHTTPSYLALVMPPTKVYIPSPQNP